MRCAVSDQRLGNKAIVTTFEGKELSNDEETQTTEIVEYVTEQLDQGKKQVMLFGDGDIRVGEMTRVQRIIGDQFEDLESTYIAIQARSRCRSKFNAPNVACSDRSMID